MLRRIVYTSVAAPWISMTEVYDLIRGAHNRNSRTGITGGLIFLDGHFFQVIEGIPSAVEPVSKRIFRDKRHSGIALRQDEIVEEALFPSEWMALRDGRADRSASIGRSRL